MAQENISDVSQEIERKVTKSCSKDFSRTESRFLGALSKLDEFLLNPQVRTCSVAVPGTYRNSDSENREPPGDRSPNDRCPKAVFSSHHSGNLKGSELEETHHTVVIHCESKTIRSFVDFLLVVRQFWLRLILMQSIKFPASFRFYGGFLVERGARSL